MVTVMAYGLLGVGLGLGGVLGWLASRQTLQGQLLVANERLRASEQQSTVHEQRVRAEVEHIARKVSEESSTRLMNHAQERWKTEQQEAVHALDVRKNEVEHLIKPLRDEMAKMMSLNHEMEKERTGAYEGIKRHLKDLGDKTESLSTRTVALSSALTSSSQTRGNWGEVKLRRLFEMAGLSEHVDFDEQVTLDDGSRPDFVVRLPQNGVLPIDSKAAGAHFLRATELDPGPQQEERLRRHAKATRERIMELSAKGYQNAIEGEFDHVIMFIPSEAMAASAFSFDPDLMEYALSRAVLIATPVTMLGLLRTVALYWQQHALAEGAKEIYDVSRELYKRITVMVNHFNKVGGHLSAASKAYNDTKNSYESRVLPQGRRLDELKVAETLQAVLPEPKDIDHVPRE